MFAFILQLLLLSNSSPPSLSQVRKANGLTRNMVIFQLYIKYISLKSLKTALLYLKSTMCPGKGYPENSMRSQGCHHCWGHKTPRAQRAVIRRDAAGEAESQRCRRERHKHNSLRSIHKTETKAKCFQATFQNQTGKRGTEMVAQLSRWCSPSAACTESLPSASTFKTD